jgi:hypothetical protein
MHRILLATALSLAYAIFPPVRSATAQAPLQATCLGSPPSTTTHVLCAQLAAEAARWAQVSAPW